MRARQRNIATRAPGQTRKVVVQHASARSRTCAPSARRGAKSTDCARWRSPFIIILPRRICTCPVSSRYCHCQNQPRRSASLTSTMNRNTGAGQQALVSVSSGQYMGVRDSLTNSVPYATRDTGRMILHDGNQAMVSGCPVAMRPAWGQACRRDSMRPWRRGIPCTCDSLRPAGSHRRGAPPVARVWVLSRHSIGLVTGTD